MSDEQVVQWCTRCPRVGRPTPDSGRGIRDTAHYYCRECRKEYHRDRNATLTPDMQVLRELEDALEVLQEGRNRNDGDVVMAIAHLQKARFIISNKPIVKRKLEQEDATGMHMVAKEEKRPLKDYMSIFWGANKVDDVAMCNRMVAAVEEHYPEAAELPVMRRVMSAQRLDPPK